MKKLSLILICMALAACTENRESIDLGGAWKIRLDPTDTGIKEKWHDTDFTEPILLPGSLQEQGFGYDVDIDTKWSGWIVDSSWYTSPRYAKYRKKGNIKVPFWLNPDKHYVGAAWYQKQVDIPAGWKGKAILLELERTHWETSLYVDGVETGHRNALSTPHRYEMTSMEPGRHTITLRVDNRVNIPVGINAHSISDHTQSNWNGLAGKLTLTAKPHFFSDGIRIYPDLPGKKIKVRIRLKGKPSAGTGNVLLQLETSEGEPVGKPVSLDFDMQNEELELETVIDAGGNVLAWSEHNPNLYRLKTVVSSPDGRDEKYTRFGFRDFKKDGTRFHLNGQPIFLRGTLECCIFPLTGYPATDNAYWAKIYRACKDFGLNHVRFHSWCPPEAAFATADSMGVYLQVECAAWADVGDGGYIDKWLYEESDRILEEYGNHPSFCMLAYGNEPGGGNQAEYLSALVDYWKSKDDRRAYTSAAGWPYVENADYWNAPDPRIQGWGEGLKSIINAEAPQTDYDFSSIIRKDMPTVSHEIGQWCAYPNFDEIKKYTGVLKAKNLEIFQETLIAKHMGDLADDFLYASGRLQTLCYKTDIEAALRTPGFAGFQLLDLHDFPGQGTALVGVLDPFWETKGYVDGREYSMFCGPAVPLIRFPKMVWLNDERMDVPLEFAYFGEKPLENARIAWTVATPDNNIIGEGGFTSDLPVGNCIGIGNIEVAFKQLKEPSQLTVTVEVENTAIKNRWNIWVYPAKKQEIADGPHIVSRLDNAVAARLAKGEKVLLISPKGNVLPEKGGDIAVGFSSIFWNTAWTRGQAPHTLGIFCDRAHPALASFPNEGYSDCQWWDIVSMCDAMVMDEFPENFRPIVHLIDDWFTNRKLGILFEAKVAGGKLMVCSADLFNDLDERPAAAQFKQSILEYMASDKFEPEQEISIESIRGLFGAT